eukprot:110056-Rhodomonas_salina.1
MHRHRDTRDTRDTETQRHSDAATQRQRQKQKTEIENRDRDRAREVGGTHVGVVVGHGEQHLALSNRAQHHRKALALLAARLQHAPRRGLQADRTSAPRGVVLGERELSRHVDGHVRPHKQPAPALARHVLGHARVADERPAHAACRRGMLYVSTGRGVGPIPFASAGRMAILQTLHARGQVGAETEDREGAAEARGVGGELALREPEGALRVRALHRLLCKRPRQLLRLRAPLHPQPRRLQLRADCHRTAVLRRILLLPRQLYINIHPPISGSGVSGLGFTMRVQDLGGGRGTSQRVSSAWTAYEASVKSPPPRVPARLARSEEAWMERVLELPATCTAPPLSHARQSQTETETETETYREKER